jgi:hypothetical protein
MAVIVLKMIVVMVMMTVLLVIMIVVLMIMIVGLMISEGEHPNIIVIAAATGQAHDSTSISTERTRSSRPAISSTSALPQLHSKMRLSSAKS